MYGVDRHGLHGLLRDTLRSERAPAGELALVFLGERAMRRLNREYRGIDRPTDVLSFSYVGEPHAGGVLGEVFVSPAVAERQAREAGCSLAEELARLCVHGTLHVLGYDDGTTADRRKMFRHQERYLERSLRGVVR